jgi:hypothetical protein
MKTISCFAFILLTMGITSNIAAAQMDTSDLLLGTNTSKSVLATEPADKVAIPLNEKPVSTILSCMNGKIKLNYALPAFTYSAILLVQDFTGRTLRTFNVNLHNADVNEYYINDLLSGTYNYTLVLDNQKKVTGEFIVKE